MAVRRALILGSVTLLVVVLILAASFLIFPSDPAWRRLTSEVPAEILEITGPKKGWNPDITDVRIMFRFVLDGEEIWLTNKMSLDQGKDFKVGKPAKVCYNPKNHREAELVPQDYECGS